MIENIKKMYIGGCPWAFQRGESLWGVPPPPPLEAYIDTYVYVYRDTYVCIYIHIREGWACLSEVYDVVLD